MFATRFFAAGAGLALIPFSAHCRSIEFSEPDGTLAGTNLDTLITQPSIVDLYNNKPGSLGGKSSSLKPLPARPGGMFIPNPQNSASKNWNSMSADELMQSMVERDVMKNSGRGLDASANSLFPRTGQTNNLNSANWWRDSGQTNGMDSGTDALKAYDPFASARRRNFSNNPQTEYSSKPESVLDFFKKPDQISPEAIQEQKAQAARVDAFRKLLEATSSEPATEHPATSFVTPGLNSSAFAGSTRPLTAPLVAPKAPVAPEAPEAPVAPGQTAYTYTPPPKPKPTGFTIQNRKF